MNFLQRLKAGYGIKIGRIEIFYHLPKVKGFTLINIKNSNLTSIFRLDWHKSPNNPNISGWANFMQLHYHRRGRGGISRHRPWERRNSDRFFWDKF